VVIADRPCVLLDRSSWGEPLTVAEEFCNACQACFRLGCPAISLGGEGPKGRPKARIVAELGLRYARDALGKTDPQLKSQVASYRAGYLAGRSFARRQADCPRRASRGAQA